MSSNFDQWIKFLKPENLKGNLISCALYIANFESFKENTIERVKFFFNTGVSNGQFTFSSEYNTSVLSRNASQMLATLLWLKEQGAINEEDLKKYEEIRQYRNELAHKMLGLLFQGLDLYVEKHSTLIELEVKIDRWWVLNVEIPTNPDFDNQEIKEADVMTSAEIRHKLMFDILTGDEETANYYYEEFIKHKTS